MNQRSKKFAKSAVALAASLLVAACGGDGERLDDQNLPPDGAAPTLAIDDNIAGDIATRSVTFIFSFS